MADDREAVLFKKVEDGYLFRAPNPWVFGRGRFFLVNETEKARLLAIMTAHSQLRFWLTFWVVFMVAFAAAVAAIALISGHDDPSIGDVMMMIALAPVCLYAALLICARPTALRVQPLLAGLSPTDQRITIADLALAQRKTISLPNYLMLAASQAILSVMFFIQAMQKTGGSLAQSFHNGSAFSAAFAGCCFAFASICLLVAALKKFRHRSEDTVAADGSLGKFLLPGFSLAISIAALGFVLYVGHVVAERHQKSAELLKRSVALKERIDKLSFAARQINLNRRIAANKVSIATLTDKLNDPAVRCGAAADTDKLCVERARQERQAVITGILTARDQGIALRQENIALQQEFAAIQTEIAALQAESSANR